MQEERKRILDLVEKGTISAQEAIGLLEALERPKQQSATPTHTNTTSSDQSYENTFEQPTNEAKQESKKDDFKDEFVEDLKRDFMQFGDRFMQFMQTAVGKVKTMEFDMPFGEKQEFHHTFLKPADEVKDLAFEIANGQVDITFSDVQEIQAVCHVKTYKNISAEEAKKEFLDKFVFAVDQQKLRVLSDMKTTQVNVEITLPKKQYNMVQVRLFNGGLTTSQLEAHRVKVKTANGKIEVKDSQLGDADFSAANGSIQLRQVNADQLEVETLNGRIYVDGELKDVEAQSVNGNVAITTTSSEARSIEGKTVSGSVEIYVPTNVMIHGDASSNFGKVDVQLPNAQISNSNEQFLQKSVRFSVEGEHPDSKPLYVKAEAKTGSIIIRSAQ